MSGVNKDGIEPSDWNMWSNHVLIELQRLNNSVDNLRNDLTKISMEVVQLKVKSSLWGAVAGAITVLMIFAVGWVQNNVEKRGDSQQPTQMIYSIPVDPHNTAHPTAPTPPTTPQPPQGP